MVLQSVLTRTHMAVAQTSLPPKLDGIRSKNPQVWRVHFVRPYASSSAPLFRCGPFCGAGRVATHGLLAATAASLAVASPRRVRSGLRLLGESAAGSGCRSGGAAGCLWRPERMAVFVQKWICRGQWCGKLTKAILPFDIWWEVLRSTKLTSQQDMWWFQLTTINQPYFGMCANNKNPYNWKSFGMVYDVYGRVSSHSCRTIFSHDLEEFDKVRTVFGYGSLIFRPGFSFKRTGSMGPRAERRGFARRFQESWVSSRHRLSVAMFCISRLFASLVFRASNEVARKNLNELTPVCFFGFRWDRLQ